MLATKELQAIEKLAGEARFGYAVTNNQIYYRDVTALLAERQELLARVQQLEEEQSRLRSQVGKESMS